MEHGVKQPGSTVSLMFPKKVQYPKDRVWGRAYCDALFSRYIRERDGFRCQKCNTHYPNGKGLEAAHHFVRGRKATRYDPDNCYALCAIPCHHFEDKVDGTWYLGFMQKKLGFEQFQALLAKSVSQCSMLEARRQFMIWYQKIKS